MEAEQTAWEVDESGGCTGRVVPCRAYKPWTSCLTWEGRIQPACQACPNLGLCQWSYGERTPDGLSLRPGAE